MTEKQFYIDTIDGGGSVLTINGVELGLHETCNLLNELHEENQSLKKKLEFFNELNKPYGTIIEENKRLKSFINRLTNDCGEIVLMNGIGYNVKKIFGDLK